MRIWVQLELDQVYCVLLFLFFDFDFFRRFLFFVCTTTIFLY